eukprot:gene20087-20627_t
MQPPVSCGNVGFVAPTTDAYSIIIGTCGPDDFGTGRVPSKREALGLQQRDHHALAAAGSSHARNAASRAHPALIAPTGLISLNFTTPERLASRLRSMAASAMTHRLHAIVLGSAAGGGVPQWNCRCRVCRLAWEGSGVVRPRTQSSIAVSADGERWLLLNASPDLRQQIWNQPALHPKTGARHSPIEAVLITNGDVDHVTGLLTLRERQPFALYGTGQTLATIADNQIFAVLADDVVTRREVHLGERFEPLAGLGIEIFPVPGKVPLWLEGAELAKGTLDTGQIGENTVGVTITAGGARL